MNTNYPYKSNLHKPTSNPSVAKILQELAAAEFNDPYSKAFLQQIPDGKELDQLTRDCVAFKLVAAREGDPRRPFPPWLRQRLAERKQNEARLVTKETADKILKIGWAYFQLELAGEQLKRIVRNSGKPEHELRQLILQYGELVAQLEEKFRPLMDAFLQLVAANQKMYQLRAEQLDALEDVVFQLEIDAALLGLQVDDDA